MKYTINVLTTFSKGLKIIKATEARESITPIIRAILAMSSLSIIKELYHPSASLYA